MYPSDRQGSLQNMARIGDMRSLSMAGALMLGLSGCMIPVYHQPQGFSSTYFRHLQQSVPVMTGAQASPAELAETSEKKERVTDAEPPAEDGDNATSDAEKSGSWWSWIRRPISPRPNAAADADDDDEESDTEEEARRESSATRR